MASSLRTGSKDKKRSAGCHHICPVIHLYRAAGLSCDNWYICPVTKKETGLDKEEPEENAKQ